MKYILTILILTMSTFAHSIKCELTQAQQLYNNSLQSSTFTSEIGETQLTLVIVDVQTESPTLVGNLGTQTLLLVGKDSGTYQWVEPKGSGLVNLLTYDTHLSLLYYAKQFRSVETMYSYVYAGKCIDFN